MADERIRLDLDLNQFTASAKEGTAALQSMAVVADQNVVPALKNIDDHSNRTIDSQRRFGMVMMDVNYIVQDFTSQLGTRGLAGAFAAIQNNIPNLVRDLGGGVGLGGVIGTVALAAAGAAQAVGAIATSSKEAAAATKELADAAERLAKLRPAGEEKATGEIEQFIKESKGSRVLQGIQSSLQRRARAQAGAMVRESIEQFGVVQETEEQIMARWAPQIQADAQRALTGMAQNDQDLGFVMQLAQENPGAFPRNFAQDLQSFTPAARAAADAEELATEQFGERASRGAAARRRRAARNQEAFDLTRQGGINEQMDAAARRMRVEQALDRRTESDIQRMETGEDRARESMQIARQFDRAVATQQRNEGRDEMAARREIARLQEEIGRAQERETKGLASHIETQQVVFVLQGMVGNLIEQLKQVTTNNRKLQTRNALLDRGQ